MEITLLAMARSGETFIVRDDAGGCGSIHPKERAIPS